MPRPSRIWSLGLACLLVATSRPSRADDPIPAVLRLGDGGHVAGRLLPSPAGRIQWRGEAFAHPFDFPTSAVSLLSWPPPETRPSPKGDFLVSLSGGDVLFGDLLAIDEKTLTLETERFGRVVLERPKVQRIRRWRGGSKLVYNGPNHLSEWTVSPEGSWDDLAGSPATTQPGATLLGDLDLPNLAVFEVELSWKSKPNFLLAIGVDPAKEAKRLETLRVRENAKPDPNPAPRVVNAGQASEMVELPESAFALEVWGPDLVALCETEASANVAAVGEIGDGPGQVRLRVYLDQKQRRLLVESDRGELLADLSVPQQDGEPRPGIVLTNIEGDVRLDRLIIDRWNGSTLIAMTDDQPFLVREGGAVTPGTIRALDAEAGDLILQGKSEESRIPLQEVSDVVLAPRTDSPERTVRITYQDGSRLSGELLGVGEDTLEMTVPEIVGAAFSPTRQGLRSLAFSHSESDEIRPTEDGPIGRLSLEGVELQGRLEPGQEQPGASALVWKPLASASASPLLPDVSGRIVYKEPQPTQPKSPRPTRPAPRPAPVVRFLQGLFAPREPGQVTASTPSQPTLYLRSGDRVPAEILRIDEQGVGFTSPVSESTFVPHEKVKAIVLRKGESAIKLGKTRRERLLTLPRIQKGNPPTHLLRSTNGDYLRGRLVGMGAETLRVEVRLEEKAVPRSLISTIIWLHPEELSEAQPVPPTERSRAATRVLALLSDGNRLSFTTERFGDGTLFGRSEALGACQVASPRIDQLLINGAADQESSHLALNRWILTPAPEPKITEIGGGSGMESTLVGKPAPDFKLDRLDGKPFQLAEHRGRVVLLDFWATWCGPCVQSMPVVERVAREFEERGVELFAVNLQETADQIKPMLERHQLSPTVVLDRDGAIAGRYGATAIPQTVLIDRDGQVSRVWVGSSPGLEAQLREAIQGLLDGEQGDGPAPEAEADENDGD